MHLHAPKTKLETICDAHFFSLYYHKFHWFRIKKNNGNPSPMTAIPLTTTDIAKDLLDGGGEVGEARVKAGAEAGAVEEAMMGGAAFSVDIDVSIFARGERGTCSVEEGRLDATPE